MLVMDGLHDGDLAPDVLDVLHLGHVDDLDRHLFGDRQLLLERILLLIPGLAPPIQPPLPLSLQRAEVHLREVALANRLARDIVNFLQLGDIVSAESSREQTLARVGFAEKAVAQESGTRTQRNVRKGARRG